jgi:hypothetical protein
VINACARPRWLRLVAAAAAAVALGVATVPADAHKAHHGSAPALSAPIATGLAGPLQLAVAPNGTVYVAQDFAGVLTRIARNGTRTDIATNPGGEIAGVDLGPRGSVYYTTTNGDPQAMTTTATALNVLRHGASSQVSDLLGFEQANNPDQVNTYGFDPPLPDDCAAQWPTDQAGPPTYTGIVDSHPYAVAARGRHVYIAEAAGNDILDVSRKGHIRVVAVLPPQQIVATADIVAANHLPDCVTGLTYGFEPVPTDVEIGPGGMLYVTTLPGGPEDPSFGARGSVYRINPRTGAMTRLATGFSGATNLALGNHGQIFVSELFASKVSRVAAGGPAPLVDVTDPAGLEFARGKLYVGYDINNQTDGGSVATIDLRHGHGHGDD